MKKQVLVPVAAVLIVAGGILVRRHASEAAPHAAGDLAAKPVSSTSHPKRPDRKAEPSPQTPASAAAPRMEVPAGSPVPDLQGIRERAETVLPSLRPLLQELLVKYPYAGAPEEFQAQKERLKAALLASRDPAVLSALVLWSREAGDRMEALAAIRAFVLDCLKQDKPLSEANRAKPLCHFLASLESDRDQALPARLFALDLLVAQTETIDPLSGGKIPLSAYCLDQSDLAQLREGLRGSIQRLDPQCYRPLLKILGAYLGVSSVARDAITELLTLPPENHDVRLHVLNALENQQSQILEEPAALRFLLSSLKETSDSKISSAAAMAFVHSPTLVSGSAPEGREVLATLEEQYRWAKNGGSDKAMKQQQGLFLLSIASSDMEGAAGFVKEALLDPSLPDGMKLKVLKRIETISTGAIYVEHSYQKTAPAMAEALASIQPQLAALPLFKDAVQAALKGLEACRKQ